MANDFCLNVKNLNKTQIRLLLKHIDRHKWFNGICDKESALYDMVYKFSWLTRDVYCGMVCDKRNDCDCHSKIHEAFIEDISDGEICLYIRGHLGDIDKEKELCLMKIIKANIADHKKLNNFSTYKDSVINFIDKYYWILFELDSHLIDSKLEVSDIL